MTSLSIPSLHRIGDVMSQYELDRALVTHAHDGLSLDVAVFLRAGANPKHENSLALRLASGGGHAECLRLLIPISDATAFDSHALGWAAQHGYAECVELLIPVSDLASNGSVALCNAASNGHADCVALLLPFSAPLMDHPKALTAAVANGHANVLSLMLDREPGLVGKLNLRELHAYAEQCGHAAMASLTASMIERAELDGAVSGPCCPDSLGRPRL